MDRSARNEAAGSFVGASLNLDCGFFCIIRAIIAMIFRAVSVSFYSDHGVVSSMLKPVLE